MVADVGPGGSEGLDSRAPVADREPIAPPTWTRAEIQRLASRGVVYLRGNSLDNEPVPAWILAGGGQAGTLSAGRRVANVHREDREQMVQGWWWVLEHPGEVWPLRYRMWVGDRWVYERAQLLNLGDHPDVGGCLLITEYEGPVLEDELLPALHQHGEVDELRSMLLWVEADTTIVGVEGMSYELTGYPPEHPLGRSVLEYLHPDGFDDAFQLWMDVTSTAGATRTARLRVVRSDGAHIWTEVTVINRSGHEGPGPIMALVCDLTTRRAQEAELRAGHQEFRMLADEVPAAVFRAEADHTISFRNSRWAELPAAVRAVEHLEGLVAAVDRERFGDELEALASAPSGVGFAIELEGADGDSVLAVQCRVVVDVVAERRSFVGSVTDVTATIRLRQQADHDGVTGLLNRQALERRLTAALLDETDVVVLFVDLDGFKMVNDTHGHEAGDVVLRVVAERLRQALRPSDVLARYGGDEFVVVCVAGPHHVGALMTRLEDALTDPIVFSGGSWRARASVGAARPRPGDDVGTVVRRADERMYTAKRRRNEPTVEREPGARG